MSDVDLTKPDYSLKFLKSPKWILGLIVFFTITFLSNFSLTQKASHSTSANAPVIAGYSSGLEGFLKKTLASNRSCPVKFDSLDYVLVGVKLNNVKVPPHCAGGISVFLKTVTLSLSGFSFSPFGPALNIETNFNGMPLAADVAVGLGGLAIVIENKVSGSSFEDPEKKISLSKLSGLIPLKLGGDLYISNFHLKSDFNFSKVEILSLNIVSKNLVIPSQTMKLPPMGLPFTIPNALNINNFLIMGELSSGGAKPKFKLARFTIGDDQSPLRSEFKGNIDLNLARVSQSSLKIKGEVKLSEDFPQKELLHNLVLQKFDQKDGFYQIQIRGTGLAALLSASSPR